MVCQAAPKTRFRALKHEAGFKGSATIIVRIIACFQPLQDLPGRIFSSPAEARDVKKPSHLFLPNKSVLIPLVLALVISVFSMRKDFSWMHNNLKPPDVRHHMVYGMPIPPPNPKKFLIFDHSGDRTSVIFNSVRYPFASSIPSMINPIIENPRTNVPDGGEEEMCEDSEEIDALLYSDSDDDNLEEEEGSSGHSLIETMTMVSSDDAGSICSKSPAKRKRDDTSLVDTASSIPGKRDDESGDRSKRAKIQETVGVLLGSYPEEKGRGRPRCSTKLSNT